MVSPIRISFCEFQNLDNAVRATIQPVSKSQITPEGLHGLLYANRRLLVLYFDRTTMPAPDQLRAFDSARNFVRSHMEPADVVAIMQFTESGLQILDDFTDDHDELLKTIGNLTTGDDTSAAFIPDASEFDVFSIDRQLLALQTALKMIESLSERKSLIYFTGTLSLSAMNNRSQLQATLNSANRTNLAIYPIETGAAGRDTSGPPLDVLYTLASQTGGNALVHPDALLTGILQAQKAATSYYVLTYYRIALSDFNGQFHRLNITLKKPNAKLEYRKSRYAMFYRNTSVDKEQQLEDALRKADPITDLVIAAEIDYFQLNPTKYFVPVTIKIPLIESFYARRSGDERTVVDFMGEVKDAEGKTVQTLRDKVEIDLAAKTLIELRGQPPIEYDTGFALAPGVYTIKLLARDAETRHTGVYLNTFVIPDLSKSKGVAISSVILSSQRAETKEALSDTNPLIQDGRKLIPSVTRVFTSNQYLSVYLQAYPRGAAPLTASISLYRGQTKAYETDSLQIAKARDTESNTLPLRFSIPLQHLSPGHYDCQVTVGDSQRRMAFWEAPIVLLP
jgi:VWFA-related protein